MSVTPGLPSAILGKGVRKDLFGDMGFEHETSLTKAPAMGHLGDTVS